MPVWPPQNTGIFQMKDPCCGPLVVAPDPPYLVRSSTSGTSWTTGDIVFRPQNAWGPVTLVSTVFVDAGTNPGLCTVVLTQVDDFTVTAAITSPAAVINTNSPPTEPLATGIFGYGDGQVNFASGWAGVCTQSAFMGKIIATYKDSRGINQQGTCLLGAFFNSPVVFTSAPNFTGSAYYGEAPVVVSEPVTVSFSNGGGEPAYDNSGNPITTPAITVCTFPNLGFITNAADLPDGGIPVTAFTYSPAPGSASSGTTFTISATITGLRYGETYYALVVFGLEVASAGLRLPAYPPSSAPIPGLQIPGLAQTGIGVIELTMNGPTVCGEATSV